MEQACWQLELRRALLRRGLPRDYVDRLVMELADHAFDCLKEDKNMIMNTQDALVRLGTPETIATSAKVEFRKRTWAGRFPYLFFTVGSFLLTILTVILLGTAIILFGVGSAWVMEDVMGIPKLTMQSIVEPYFRVTGVIFGFLPFGLAAYLLCRLSVRSSVSWYWTAIGVAIVAFVAQGFSIRTWRSEGSTDVSVGLTMESHLSAMGIVQAAFPLLICAAYFVWLHRSARTAVPTN